MKTQTTNRSHRLRFAPRAAARLLLLCAVAAPLAACPKLSGPTSAAPAAKPTIPPAPVVVAEVVRRDMPVEIKAIGRVEPVSTVMVKAQISGELVKVGFEEGQEVRKGDLLFSIDSRPFATALRQAEARLEKDRAELKNAEQDAKRYQNLMEKKATSQEQSDAAQTKAMSLMATLHVDEAAVEMARLDLEYCSIRSPINGRTGSLGIHAGNLVKANADTPMVTIYQIEPIYATFAVPEQKLGEIKKGMAGGTLKVSVTLPNQTEPLAGGELVFVDTEVDRETGTVKFKAKFDNADRRLWPGLFVNVALAISTASQAIVVPATAIQVGQKGAYAFVVKDDLTAEMRPVKPGLTAGDAVVVDEGLSAGEKVIVDGHLRVIPGGAVELKAPIGEKPPAGAEKPL